MLPSYDFTAQVLITGILPSTHWIWPLAQIWIYMAIQESAQPVKSCSYFLRWFIATKISSLYFMWLLLKHNECTRLQSLYIYINRSVPLQSQPLLTNSSTHSSPKNCPYISMNICLEHNFRKLQNMLLYAGTYFRVPAYIYMEYSAFFSGFQSLMF